jgi:hypothetical protein
MLNIASWQEALINPENSIRKVMRVIDFRSIRMTFIVSGENILLGTVIDGDIRRC